MSEALPAEVAAHIFAVEGGFQRHPDDPGNYRPDGTLVGTMYGISARSYPTVDIPNLTKDEASRIYARDFWTPSGAAAAYAAGRYGLALATFDAAVHSGVSRAKTWLAEAQDDYRLAIAARLRFMTNLDTWPTFGRGWARRIAGVLEAATKAEVAHRPRPEPVVAKPAPASGPRTSSAVVTRVKFEGRFTARLALAFAGELLGRYDVTTGPESARIVEL